MLNVCKTAARPRVGTRYITSIVYRLSSNSLFPDNPVPYHSDILDLHLDNIARLKELRWRAGVAYTGGSARGNDIAWLKGHAQRQMLDDAWYVEYHLAGVAVLLFDAVDPR